MQYPKEFRGFPQSEEETRHFSEFPGLDFEASGQFGDDWIRFCCKRAKNMNNKEAINKLIKLIKEGNIEQKRNENAFRKIEEKSKAKDRQ